MFGSYKRGDIIIKSIEAWRSSNTSYDDLIPGFVKMSVDFIAHLFIVNSTNVKKGSCT